MSPFYKLSEEFLSVIFSVKLLYKIKKRIFNYTFQL